MSDPLEVRVPDIGDFSDVPIIEVLVKPGDQVSPEDPLVTLESDKATMDVPSPSAGTVGELRVNVGDTVSEGSVILTLEGAASGDGAGAVGGGAGAEVKEHVEEEAEPAPADRPPSYGSESGEYSSVEVRVPDIGDFSDVPVIEVMVNPGDTVAEEDPLVTLESDKATMDVPSPAAGTVRELRIAVGDTVSEGSPILVLETAGAATDGAGPAAAPPATEGDRPQAAPPAPPSSVEGSADRHADVVVLGAGPGGYTAAFRAADLGL
ncbi:MAG: dihydrolipoamide dehydrogenase, partial [Solirubrobacteraceae bacterium]|nr:dihydrolipoamide dehydrogenase [Solirubrobacteraceae bacterium]